jgi:hypothetical protein
VDVLSEQALDLGLTLVGYLAAVGLGMLLHSAIVGRRRRPAVSAVSTGDTGERVSSSEVERASRVQFIDLSRQRSGVEVPSASAVYAAAPGRDGRRDRVEIIRLARQMLRAGAAAERVKRTLPISEAELTLLQSINGN